MMATVPPPHPNMWKGAEALWKNLSFRLICPDCHQDPPNLDYPSTYEIVCASCGLVLGDREIDPHSEWRTFQNDENNEDPSRVGEASNPLLDGDQLETSIQFGAGGSRVRELHRAQNRIASEKTNKTLLKAYNDIGIFCEGFKLPKNVSDTAKYLYKIVDESKVFKSNKKGQEAIIAGCIFIACRQCKVPRTFVEIFAVTKVSKRELGRTFKSLERFFRSQDGARLSGVVNRNESYTTTTATKPSDLCNRFCNILDLPFQVTSVAIALADRVASTGELAGRSPLSVVAASIYMASALMGQERTLSQIREVIHINEGTVRGAYKQLYSEKDRLIDPSWLKDGKGDVSKLPAS